MPKARGVITPHTQTGTPVMPVTKPRRRRSRSRSRSRTTSATMGGTQYLSAPRRSGGGQVRLAGLINEFIAVGQDMNVFKPNLNTQALANVWARIGAHAGLTL